MKIKSHFKFSIWVVWVAATFVYKKKEKRKEKLLTYTNMAAMTSHANHQYMFFSMVEYCARLLSSLALIRISRTEDTKFHRGCSRAGERRPLFSGLTIREPGSGYGTSVFKGITLVSIMSISQSDFGHLLRFTQRRMRYVDFMVLM